jgi:uncharacterized membrane protein
MADFLGLLLIVAGIVAYFLPIYIAKRRNCKSTAGIAIVSLLLGWTFVGWVGSLAWAAIGEADEVDDRDSGDSISIHLN